MEKTYEMTDQAVLAELGDRFSRLRLQRNLTQAQLAREAGVSKRTVIRLESGESSQVTNLIRVVRVLGLLGNLDAFVPPPLSSPLAQLRSQMKERRRASPGVTKSGPPPQWTWGDDLSKTRGEP
jgi:transcriptional regulator with XRE-family HTH domain